MPKYEYIANNEAGEEEKGTVTARNKDHATAMLKQKNFRTITVKEKKSAFDIQFGAPPEKVSLTEMVIFTRQLSTMISAGIPLLESLEILEEQQTNKGFGLALGDVVDKVRGGNDFSAALATHPKIFEKIYVSMIKAGETSGQLDTILDRLAEYQEDTAKLIREIKSAMTYPAISLTMIFAITGFLLIAIIPKFKEIFFSLNITLPAITSFLLALSDFLVAQTLNLFLAMIAAVFALIAYGKTKIGRFHYDWLKLRVPIFGDLFQKVAISRFARTFATMIRSGVPILGTLEIVAQTAGNVIIEDAINQSMNSVKQGESLATPLAEFWVFPPMVTRMIAIGERAGALESLLEKISEFYDQQVSAKVESLTSLIEPVMIGVMGVVVGGIVLAVFLPIFKLQAELANN